MNRFWTNRSERSLSGDPASINENIPPLRSNRDFLILWSSQAVSAIGVRITSVALPIASLIITGSATTAGFVGFVGMLPFLILFLPAGTLVDRLNIKWTMIVAELGGAIVLGSLGVAFLVNGGHVVHILAVAFLAGAFLVFFELAEVAALPEVVPAEQLPGALALAQARQNGASMLGQPAGGALIGIGLAAPFLANALSYLASFVGLLFLSTKTVPSAPRCQQLDGILRETRRGLTWLWRHRFLRSMLPITGGINLAFGAVPIITIVFAQALGATPFVVGIILSCGGIGAIAGSIMARYVQQTWSVRAIVWSCLVLWLLQLSLLPLATSIWELAALTAVGPLVGVIFNTVLGTYRYAVTPPDLRARTVSAARLVAYGALPLGSLLGGTVTEHYGPQVAFSLLAVMMLVTSVVAFGSPTIRQERQVVGGDGGK